MPITPLSYNNPFPELEMSCKVIAHEDSLTTKIENIYNIINDLFCWSTKLEAKELVTTLVKFEHGDDTITNDKFLYSFYKLQILIGHAGNFEYIENYSFHTVEFVMNNLDSLDKEFNLFRGSIKIENFADFRTHAKAIEELAQSGEAFRTL